jgi:hypothetical protein
MGAVGVAMAEEFRNTIMHDERRNTIYMASRSLFGMGIVAPWMAGIVQGQLS